MRELKIAAKVLGRILAYLLIVFVAVIVISFVIGLILGAVHNYTKLSGLASGLIWLAAALIGTLPFVYKSK